MDQEKIEQMNRRIARREELDEALAKGALTLEDVLAIPPTETSPEHHQVLVRTLSGKAIDNVVL